MDDHTHRPTVPDKSTLPLGKEWRQCKFFNNDGFGSVRWCLHHRHYFKHFISCYTFTDDQITKSVIRDIITISSIPYSELLCYQVWYWSHHLHHLNEPTVSFPWNMHQSSVRKLPNISLLHGAKYWKCEHKTISHSTNMAIEISNSRVLSSYSMIYSSM